MDRESSKLVKVIEKLTNSFDGQKEALILQTEALNSNIVNKECKSKIYEKIAESDNKRISLENNLNTLSRSIETHNRVLVGDNISTNGLVKDMKELKEEMQDLRFEFNTHTKKIEKYFYIGTGIFIAFSLIPKLFDFLKFINK